MNKFRPTVGLLGAAALMITLLPGIAQAAEGKPAGPPATSAQGPAVLLGDGPRTVVPSPDGTEARSEFFAGHALTAADATVNEGVFMVHDWECGAEDDGVISSILTFDDEGFFNGGPGIFMFCQGGDRTYAPVFLDFDFGQQPIDQPVAPGDLVKMTATREGGVATYTMENLTQGWTESTEGTDDFVNGTVQIGDNAITLGGTPVGPPVFGRDPVKNVVLDGTPLSESGSVKTQMVNAQDEVVERATKYRAVLPDQRFSLINKS